MTPAQLAKKTALSSGFISDVLSGKKRVRRSTQIFLAVTLQVNSDWLAHGRGEMDAPHVTETPQKPPATTDEKLDLLIRQMNRLIIAFDTRRDGSLLRGKHRRGDAAAGS